MDRSAHLAHPLEDPDLLLHILLQSGINHDYDAQCPNPERAALRGINSTAAKLIDGLCTSYRDTRRSGDAMLLIDPAGVASRAAAALRQLGPLRHLQLEGLDDDALATVLAEAGRSASRSPSPGSPGQCRGLETLNLQRSVFSGTCLYTCHPDLTDALPERSPIIGDASLGAGLTAPSRLLPRLLELDLGGCGQLTDAGLEALTAEAPLLKCLRITVNALLQRPRLSCPWLRSATISICANLQDDAVNSLCHGAPLLQELNLWRCSSLASPVIRAPYLETLNMCECVELTDSALRSISMCDTISSLLLAGCEALGGTTLHWGGGNALTTLDVSDIVSTSDAQLTAACAASPDLARLDFSRSGVRVQSPVVGGPKLVTLLCTKCENLVDEAVSTACDRSPVLTTLMLALCTSLHTPRIRGESLADLNLSGCFLLQDAAVSHACAHCPSLSRLTLSLCAALIEPEVRGPSLKRIELSHAEQLRRPQIGGPKLEELRLSGCSNLEDDAVEQACNNSPKLRRLAISGCAKLSSARVASASLRELVCHSVSRDVVDVAADRMSCPHLTKIVCETYADAEGFEEVN